MPSISDLYKIHLRQLELTLAQSEILLQREGGLDGELRTSGSICEQFLRSTLQKYVVPGQFRVTSGYIATPKLLMQRNNLPQCDVLIADGHIPALMKLVEVGVEVLPVQAVIGVIEAKRVLTKSALKDALEHIAKVVDSIGRATDLKTDKQLNGFNKYVGCHNHSSCKPLLGVVAMANGIQNFGTEAPRVVIETKSLIDFVWTLDGHALFPAIRTDAGKVLYYTSSARPETKPWTEIRPC